MKPSLFRGPRLVSLLGLAAALTLVTSVQAQEPAAAGAPAAPGAPGRIVGRILDGQTGSPVIGAVVEVVGALVPVRSTSGVNGRYSLAGVPSGAASIRVRMIGYTPKVVTGIAVTAGGTVEQDVSLTAQVVELEELTVTAAAERGTVARALDEQRTALGVTNAITTEQIAKSPDSDAAEAVQRVSGVSVQEGKYVVVRGLGERYTQTSLNGARLPSPEPERKVVPLDLFPSGTLQTVKTSKTFTPDLPGDFSGAQVDIQTREFPAQTQFSLSLGSGYNSAYTGDQILAAPRESGDLLALGAGEREIPGALPPFGDFRTIAPTQEETNGIVNDFRDSWSPDVNSGAPPTSFAASLGGTQPAFSQPIGFLASLTYGLDWEAHSEETRATARNVSGGGTTVQDHFSGSSAKSSVLWGGLLNFSTFLGTGTRLALNNTLNRSADNEARTETGYLDQEGAEFQIERLRYVERSVRSNQLIGEHQLNGAHRIDWSLTSSAVSRTEPDRSEIMYALEVDPVTQNRLPPAWYSNYSEGAVRTFADLDEDSFEGAANYRFVIGGGASPHALRVGGLYRTTDRTADNSAYSITSFTLDRAARELSAEQIFDGRYAQPGDANFRLAPLGQGGSYTADDQLYAGYAMLDYSISSRLRFVGGARVEQSEVTVRAQPVLGSAITTSPEYLDVLPSVGLNYQLAENHVLRLAGSQTLSRPEYRELAPVQYREVVAGDLIQGNDQLERALIQNLDLRWEWYPNPGEVLSVGVFAKQFDQPLERVYLPTSGTNIVSFTNADNGRNLGIEFELRKGLGMVAPVLAPFTFFGNVTVMDSEVEYAPVTVGSSGTIQYEARSMVGQSPYVVNAGLGYASEGGTSATLLYNVQGRRIATAAQVGLPAAYEEERNVIDFSVRVPLSSGVAIRADAGNLLDAPYEVTQGSVTREHYKTGRTFSLGFSWGTGL